MKEKIFQILNDKKKVTYLFIFINMVSFLLPFIKTEEWNCENYDQYEKLANYKYKYWYGFNNLFCYLNVLIILLLSKKALNPTLSFRNNQYETPKFNKYSFITFSAIYCFLYFCINLFMITFPSQLECTYNKMGIGFLPNIISTVGVLIYSYKYRIEKIINDNWN